MSERALRDALKKAYEISLEKTLIISWSGHARSKDGAWCLSD